MVYIVPFANAVKFLCVGSVLGDIEFYVRMKAFLLFCITYYINTNRILPPAPLCGWASTYLDVSVTYAFASLLIITTLALTKPQAEIIAEIVLVFIFSLWTSSFPLHFIMKLGSYAAEFRDLFAYFQGVRPNDEDIHGGVFTLAEFNTYIMYASLAFAFGIQGYLADWLLEITVHEVTRSEQAGMQILMTLPVLVGVVIKMSKRVMNTWLLDILPYAGLVPASVPAFWTILNIQSPPNPLYFAIPHEKWFALGQGMGWVFLIKWFYLQLKLCIKYNMLTYEGVQTLRVYFMGRVLLNFLKLKWEDRHDYDKLFETFAISFQQDYMMVFASSGFISKIVTKFSRIGIKLSTDSKNDNVTRHALGYIPTIYIILGFINVAYECRLCERMINFGHILKFCAFMLMMFSYTACWADCVSSAAFTDLHHHVAYIKVFCTLFILQLMFIICFRDEEEVMPETECENDEHCIYFKIVDKDEYICEEYENYEVVNFFAFQIGFMCLCSVCIIVVIMFYTWYFMHEDTEEHFEHRLMLAMMAHVMMEVCIAFFIFDRISVDCYTNKVQRVILMCMAVMNIWSTIVERGICICYSLYNVWRRMAAILDRMKDMDEDDLEDYDDDPICVICEDDVEEAGKLAECGHLFHDFCIKEWIGEYGAVCPECNAEFKQLNETLKIITRETDEEDEIDPSLNPEMLTKIVEEMIKFDYKTSFWTEQCDVEKPEEDEDEEEEESDDDY